MYSQYYLGLVVHSQNELETSGDPLFANDGLWRSLSLPLGMMVSPSDFCSYSRQCWFRKHTIQTSGVPLWLVRATIETTGCP